jgi:hypothetical protein
MNPVATNTTEKETVALQSTIARHDSAESKCTKCGTEGLNGIRYHLSGLVCAVNKLATLFKKNNSVALIHKETSGYVLMVRLYPPGLDSSFYYQCPAFARIF